MILEQHYLGCLAQASYLIVDESSKVAAVVDPRRDVELYLERAASHGARIEHVLLTHFHADFLSGHLELAHCTGATIHMGAPAEPEYEVHSLSDGEEIALGPKVRLRALATPGHTPESTSYLVFDADHSTETGPGSGSEQPHAVFTGDTLFIGDVGRPDLLASSGISAEEMAGQAYDSLHQKLMSLPDETLLYPGHGAGSACGKNLSSETVSTIGQQRAFNYALQIPTREEFVASLTAGQPPAPAYFPRTAGLNKSRHAVLAEVLSESLLPMSLDEVLAARDAGAQLLDVRDKDAFAQGHLAGSVSIGLDGNLASWAGSLLDLATDIVVIGEPGQEREAVTRLGRIGLDRVRGYLQGGAGAFASRPDLTVRIERTSALRAAAELDADEAPVVLDVRFPLERETAHIAGSLAVSLRDLAARLADVPRDRRLLVHCKSGYRSMTAASLLLRAGFDQGRVVDVAGGIDAWIEGGLPGVVGSGHPAC